MQIIGIDIGTTTISGAVLEYENEKTVKLLEAKTIENGGFMPTANEWEKIQDAGAIVKKAEKLLDDLLDKYPQTERDRSYRTDAWDRIHRSDGYMCQSFVYMAGWQRKSL